MSAPTEDELLTTAGMPGWVRWAAGLGAVALVVALLVVKAGSHSGGAPAATPSATPTVPVAAPFMVSSTLQELALPSRATPPDQVVADAGATWVLDGRTLLRRIGGPAGWQSVPVAAPGGTPMLTLEREEHHLWVFGIGAARTRLQAFDARTLRPLGSVAWPHQVLAAAALRRGLYVTGPDGLFRIDTDGLITRIQLPPAERVLDIVADPTRDRVLTLVQDGSDVIVMQLGDIARTNSAPVPRGFVEGLLDVTASGAIWLAGYAGSGAILDRLDPGSLRPVAVSPLTGRLAAGAVVLSSGDHSLFVESAGGGQQLWCVDDQTGTPAERWTFGVAGAGLSTGHGYALADGGVGRLELGGGCTG